MSSTVKVKTDGPILVEGEFRLTDAAGEAFDLGGRTAISLCRCGASANKPFCDGSHRPSGFRSECPARVLPPAK
jgi:CDGSH-type Zn-finger protein